jgi:hypothetical protein
MIERGIRRRSSVARNQTELQVKIEGIESTGVRERMNLVLNLIIGYAGVDSFGMKIGELRCR